jgi:uroporphyrinogen-III decarboxylase
LYQERRKRLLDTIELKKTDRVPITPFAEAFPIRYYGIKMADALKDHKLRDEAFLRYHEEFQPDAGENHYGIFGMFTTLDQLGYQGLKWAGHGLGEDSGHQYQDRELMPPEHYDWLLYDPTDFLARYLWPKIYANLAPLAKLGPFRNTYSYISSFNWAGLADPSFKEVFLSLARASEAASETLGAMAAYVAKLSEAGFPQAWGSISQAPLDVVADFFRGVKGLLSDLRRRPDKVMAACEKLIPVMVEQGVSGCRASGVPVCFMPLHMMIDSFMSQEQFERFYWPTLLELMRAMIAEGVHPYLLVEGVCDQRLPIMIRDVPPATCVFHIEGSDIFKAKRLARDKVCLRGNVPVSILMTGTPDDVRAYCKRLIDEVAPGGGFLMDTGVNLTEAKPENVKAMFEYTREHGVY